MIGGLILAAGEGKRFGAQPKLLAELGGRPLLEHAIRAQSAVTEIDRVVVVLGAHADEIRAGVDFGRASAVICDAWAEGLSRSLRRGLDELSGAEKVVVTLGDQPLISTDAVSRLLAEPPGTRAVYDGVPGHPVVLGPEHVAALGAVQGDRGAGELLAGGLTVECRDLCAGRDIDTEEELDALRALFSAASAGGQLGGPDSEFVVVEWGDSGESEWEWIAPLHVHHADDEAWYVLEGALRFKLGDEIREAGPGSAVLAPKGTPHAYGNARRAQPARYLLMIPPRIFALVKALHEPGAADYAEIFRAHESELLS